MERIPWECDLTLTVRRSGGEVTVLRAESADADVVLPGEIGGAPVTAIAHHAFTPGRKAPEGERIRFACGPEREADNSRIRRLTLPDGLLRVGDYAFYRCSALEELTLGDRIRDWGGCVFMNCPDLRRFTLRLADERGETICRLADELSRELEMLCRCPNGEEMRLIFPEYRESLEENKAAHHFDYNIFGAGYPYHHSFRSHTFVPGDYDRLWPAYLAAEHDPDCALRLAWWRLRTPHALTAEAGEEYLHYLRRRCGDVLDWLLSRRDTEGLSWFLDRAEPDRETLSAACETARRQEATEAQALLLEQLHRRFARQRRRRLEL